MMIIMYKFSTVPVMAIIRRAVPSAFCSYGKYMSTGDTSVVVLIVEFEPVIADMVSTIVVTSMLM